MNFAVINIGDIPKEFWTFAGFGTFFFLLMVGAGFAEYLKNR